MFFLNLVANALKFRKSDCDHIVSIQSISTNNAYRIKTVMTIDDESIDQMIYKPVLKLSGVVQNVVDFQLAEDALAYFRNERCERPEIVFLDIHMPKLNGFEFLEHAIAEFGQEVSDCEIIMLTISLDSQGRDRAARYPMVKDYLSKPLTKENVQNAAQFLIKDV